MLSAFRNALKIPELRGKILFTIAIIAIYRLGSHLPVPGVDFKGVHDFLKSAGSQNNSAFNLINLFSGGALTQFAIFALGIMPYITSSIIMQLLGVVIPRLEALQKEGENGRKKIQQYTRYVTVALALLQSAGIVTLAHRGGLLNGVDIFPGLTAPRFALAVLTLTAGTARASCGRTGCSCSPWCSPSACSSSSRSSSSSRPSAGSRSSTPSAWSAGVCTAARRPTSRSR